jgi:hypothetical protein
MRYELVRELVKDPELRIKDIAAQTGYNKGHVSRLRKEAALSDVITQAVAAERDACAAICEEEAEILMQISLQVDCDQEAYVEQANVCKCLADEIRARGASINIEDYEAIIHVIKVATDHNDWKLVRHLTRFMEMLEEDDASHLEHPSYLMSQSGLGDAS